MTCWDTDFGLLPPKIGLKYAPDGDDGDDVNVTKEAFLNW